MLVKSNSVAYLSIVMNMIMRCKLHIMSRMGNIHVVAYWKMVNQVSLKF